MIDLKALENELRQCRLARLDAEAAERDVEEMIWQVQHFDEAGPLEIEGIFLILKKIIKIKK